VKNRIHATLGRHNIQVPGADLFCGTARKQLGMRLPELPVHCREAVEQELATVDFLKTQIEAATNADWPELMWCACISASNALRITRRPWSLWGGT
jgi:hypothetical protein